jgi:hypothetical protein
MRSIVLAVALICGCGSDDHHHPEAIPAAPPVVASVLVTVEPTPVTVVSTNPVLVEIETKPVKIIKGVEVDLKTYEYKYRYKDEEEERDVKESKKNADKKDG